MMCVVEHVHVMGFGFRGFRASGFEQRMDNQISHGMLRGI